jgi:F-type H+-transporting ATPase subunit gamma
MANTRELRRKIKSTKNTAQITKAMQMVSAVKMRRAQDQALNGRPYSENLNEALSRLLPRVDKNAHPLLFGNNSKNTGVILLSTDKGLCGSLNTNLTRLVHNFLSGHPVLDTGSINIDSRLRGNDNVVFYTVGKKGRSFVVKSGKDLIADFENPDLVIFRQAVQLTNMVKDSFKEAQVGEVFLVYPHFVSTIKQEPKMVKLLPVGLENVIASETKQSQNGEYLYEPNVDALLDSLLLHEVQIQIYQAMLETKASEHSARMVAMKNATDNAKELIEDYTLTYNQVRQDSITRELLEISSAAAAME